ncbi:hypothetical protein [Shewanella sp. UCD-KL12]|uniref:hypothetical protein n=1 Tax=Shewanella sp. UCD-KL12 TaxID=1917163 RepID=UPI000970EAC4|nr:hypothetical protein [Shewanella sp. UCD-KL12]
MHNEGLAKAKTSLKKVGLGLLCSSVVMLTGCNDDDHDNSDELVVEEPKQVTPSPCFWVGPYNVEHPDRNFAYPDTGANYWHAGYILPAGAKLKLNGEYPYARYISINSYRADTSPASALTDNDIEPDAGSVNPYRQGAERQGVARDFTIELANGEPDGDIPVNTLYDHAEPSAKSTLIYRVYVADEGSDEFGNVALPAVELTLDTGEVLVGEQACSALQVDTQNLAIPLIPAETYQQVRSNPAVQPARNPAVWRAAYNGTFGFQCAFLGRCDGTPERQVTYYANADNQYVSTFLNNEFGAVAVTRGKLPFVPKTLASEAIFDESDSQLRYWSICQNEYYSQMVTDCIYDEQLTVDEEGYYTVVTSLLDDKPLNATNECGYNYLPWTEKGDGFGRMVEGGENRLNEALLIVRNMLPKEDFHQAIQNTAVPGDEYAVMGAYLPTTEYMSRTDFEGLGCSQ